MLNPTPPCARITRILRLFDKRARCVSQRSPLARGPGLVAQKIFGFGPASNDSNKTLKRTFRPFSRHYFSSCAHCTFVILSDSGNKSNRSNFLHDSCSYLLPKTFRKHSKNMASDILNRSSSAEITSYF